MWRVLLAAMACGCSSAASGPGDAGKCSIPLQIADPDRFTLTAEERDPFRVTGQLDASTSSSVARGRCGALDVKPEPLGDTPSFSITTLFCSWGTAETTALADVAEGAPLSVRIWHFSHLKIERAEASLLLALDDRPLWRATVPLPSEGALINAELTAPFAIPAGGRLLWHVQNHGQNSWNFLALEGVQQGDCPAGGD